MKIETIIHNGFTFITIIKDNVSYITSFYDNKSNQLEYTIKEFEEFYNNNK